MTDVIFHLAYNEAMRDPLVQSILKRHTSRDEALLDPDLNAAFDEAFQTAHNAMAADPFGHERKEAARLLEKVQAAYAAPGLDWHYHGETSPPLVKGFRWINGMGYWTGGETEPRDIAAVSRLLSTLSGIDRGPSESGRMLMAKRLIVLLQRAQKECNETPIPNAFYELTERQKEVVSILWNNGIRSIQDAIGRGYIVERVKNPNPDQVRWADDVKRDLMELRRLHLVLTKGKGAAMKNWLSPEGAALGEYLHNT